MDFRDGFTVCCQSLFQITSEAMSQPYEQEPNSWLYTAAQTRALDRMAIEHHGIAGYELMCRAGAAAFAVLRQRWPMAHRVRVLCGIGNNGGDGYVLARLAQEAGLAVKVVQLGDAGRIGGEARQALDALQATGVMPEPYREHISLEADVMVDALLGTGLERPVEGDWRDAIEAMNALPVPRLALDIPSGLHADRGVALGAAVQATVTVTFIGRKQGLYTGRAADYAGEVLFADLQLPASIYQNVPAEVLLLTRAPLGPLAMPRLRSAHKGCNGHVLMVGGAVGMPGAMRLAGEAALRTGAGLVSLATHPDHAANIPMTRPELMCQGVMHGADLAPLLKRATVVAVGPGLGTADWGRSLFGTLLDSPLPLVVDADALNLLAQEPVRRGNWILTPHPGEAARLLGSTVAEVEADRFAAVRALAERYGGTVVLKGAGTLIEVDGSPVVVCNRGNPGMASGGMGDVLTGVITALRAQGLAEPAAAEAGVWVHAAAGDHAARHGERGMLASDLIAALRREVNPA